MSRILDIDADTLRHFTTLKLIKPNRHLCLNTLYPEHLFILSFDLACAVSILENAEPIEDIESILDIYNDDIILGSTIVGWDMQGIYEAFGVGISRPKDDEPLHKGRLFKLTKDCKTWELWEGTPIGIRLDNIPSSPIDMEEPLEESKFPCYLDPTGQWFEYPFDREGNILYNTIQY